MRFLLPCTLVLAACRFDTSTNANVPANDADILSPDADPNAPDGSQTQADASPTFACDDWDMQPSLFDPCGGMPVGGPNVLLQDGGLAYVYSTTNGTFTAPGGSPINHITTTLGSGQDTVRVLVTSRFAVGPNARLRVEGDKPLLVVAWGDIIIDGTIDLSSNMAQQGAGSNYDGCLAAGNGTDNSEGGSGGGGGGFGNDGAPGGVGGNGAGDGAGGQGGTAANAVALRGGCPGGNGGNGSSVGLGLGGNGGGAIYLNARQQLRVTGRILAGGQGGNKATGGRSAGGGGGSGGLIALESRKVTLSAAALLAANGGGGGGGGNMNAAKIFPGQAGQASDQAALGGAGDNGSNGGDGGALDTDATEGDDDSRGAGAGGGAVGIINITSDDYTDQGATISPTESSDTYPAPL